MATFYAIVSRQAYADLITTGHLAFDGEGDEQGDLWESPMNDWMMVQMRKRLPETAFSNDQTQNYPHFLYCDTDDINWTFISVNDIVLLKLQLNKENVVMFDDNRYYMITNDICNGGLSKPYLYLAHSEADEEANKEASSEEKMKSWERLFDLNVNRDLKYCGPISLRGMTPYISKSMIQAVYARPRNGI